MNFSVRPSRTFAASLWLALIVGCAGYQVGNRALFPDHIDTVYVPIFESVSFRRNLGERLTEAVIKEIEARTPYKVVGPQSPDSILSGEIAAENKHVVVIAPTGEPRQSEVSMTVRVRWIERNGNVIRDGAPIPLDPDTVDVLGTGKVVPEVGQSITTAQQQALQRIAAQVVSLMEAPWGPP